MGAADGRDDTHSTSTGANTSAGPAEPVPTPAPGVRPWARSLAICTFGSFTTIVGMTMLVPFLPVYIRQLGVQDPDAIVHWSAICFGATYLVAALVAPLWGMLGDRWGRKSMLVRAGLGMSIAIGLTGLAQDVGQLLALRLLTGLLGGFASGAMILVADLTPVARRAFAVGVLTSGVMAGNLAGPVLGGLLPPLVGPRVVFGWTGALIFTAFLAVVLGLPADRPQRRPVAPDGPATPAAPSAPAGPSDPPAAPGPPGAQGERAPARASAAIVLLLAIASLITFASMSVEPFITLLSAQLPGGQPAALWGGIALSATAAGTMIAGPVLGRAADAIGPRRVLALSLAAAALCASAQYLAHSAPALVALRFALGLAVGGLAPAATSALRALVPAARVGRVLGLMVAAQHAGQVLGPLFGAWVATAAGMREAFLASGAVLALGAGLAALALRRRNQPS
ncbi:MFS transporter [Brevibacterium sp. 5221]|uniref:MFS transporter n=1 Tax=Brevibacterium rongguiense TaxID=2695267 RepID=A0A6N9H636_9MICO|nr:MFS transporter [Brevibacterium rongguiense]MYM19409.1 MFS transporter [Brevibacterium rongguiense]